METWLCEKEIDIYFVMLNVVTLFIKIILKELDFTKKKKKDVKSWSMWKN